MNIKLLSDLHIEGFYNKNIYLNKDNADVLVLAGDIHVGAKNVYQELLKAKEYYEHVVYVQGNHENYHAQNSYEVFKPELRDLLFSTSNIHYLDNDTVKIGDTTFLGTPLWTNFRGSPKTANAVRLMISDFKWYSPHVCMQRGIDAQKWLKEAYATTPGTKIIVTHWLPAIECIDPQYAGESLLNTYFANDMGDWIRALEDTPYWMFGHTHSSVDITLGKTRLLANPAGYARKGSYENKEFKQ